MDPIKEVVEIASDITDPNDPKKMTSVALLLLALGASLLFPVLAFGGVPWVFEGFAPRHMVNVVAQQQLDEVIFNTRKEQCRAKTEDARQAYTRRLQDKKDQWRKLIGYEYLLPGCGEF